jgi:hypothetical protein
LKTWRTLENRLSRLERDYFTQSRQAAKKHLQIFASLPLGVSLFPLKPGEPENKKPRAAKRRHARPGLAGAAPS